MSDGMDSGSSDSGSSDSGGSTDSGGAIASGSTDSAGWSPPSPPPAPPPPPPSYPPPAPPRYPGGGTAFPAAPPAPWRSEQAGPNYAKWGIRLGGYLIDFVIFAAITLVLALLMRHSHALEVHLMMKRGANRRRSFSALPFVITGLAYIAYGTVFCGSRRGQTIGMMVVGIRAVRDGTFARLGYGRAFARALFEGLLRLIELLSLLLGVIWLVDMLFPLWDKRRQTLHDKVAGSVVLRGQPAG